MSEKKRLIKNTGIIALGNLSTKIVSFLLLPLYTGILTTAEYGTVENIMVVGAFLTPFVSFLTEESMFRFLLDCKDDNEKSTVISLSILFALVGGILFLLITTPILQLINYEYSAFLIAYVLATVTSMMVSALLRGIGQITQYAIFNFISMSLKIILNVLFIAVLKQGITGMLCSAILSSIITSILYIFKMHIWEFISFENLQPELSKAMLKYSLPLIPNKLAWTITNLSDHLIIMSILGASSAGIYAIAYKFPNFIGMFYGFFDQSWRESSARVLNTDHESDFYNEVYTDLRRFLFSVAMLLIAGMPLIFKLLVNESYNDAANYVPILLLATFFSNVGGFYDGVFTAHKDTNVMAISTVLPAVLNLTTHLLMIKYIGLYAGAFSTLIAMLSLWLFKRIKVTKYIKFYEPASEVVVSLLVCLSICYLYYSKIFIYQTIGVFIALGYAFVMNKKFLSRIVKKCFEKTRSNLSEA